ncbi:MULTISPECIES: ProQ/FinO family protein [unclassified Caballeronia]|uniref:ProQ/FinO family protein n=1 Tax=unclassified Caballeronia TaxID=2646786 RepID=UPI0032EDFF08
MGFEKLAALKALLDQGVKSETVASRSMSPPLDEKRACKLPTRPPRTSADAAARAIITIQRHFPHAFPRSPTPKVPLKVGILKDLIALAVSIGLSERDTRNGIKLWCRGQRYWICLVEGNVRVDLTGAIAGVVTAAEADYGKSQERTRLARRRDRFAKAMVDRSRK